MIFIKINDFLSKIGPIRALWAHMGPNPDRAPTRTGPQPGPGPIGVENLVFDVNLVVF